MLVTLHWHSVFLFNVTGVCMHFCHAPCLNSQVQPAYILASYACGSQTAASRPTASAVYTVYWQLVLPTGWGYQLYRVYTLKENTCSNNQLCGSHFSNVAPQVYTSQFPITAACTLPSLLPVRCNIRAGSLLAGYLKQKFQH